jgi:hypothetical protein
MLTVVPNYGRWRCSALAGRAPAAARRPGEREPLRITAHNIALSSSGWGEVHPFACSDLMKFARLCLRQAGAARRTAAGNELRRMARECRAMLLLLREVALDF